LIGNCSFQKTMERSQRTIGHSSWVTRETSNHCIRPTKGSSRPRCWKTCARPSRRRASTLLLKSQRQRERTNLSDCFSWRAASSPRRRSIRSILLNFLTTESAPGKTRRCSRRWKETDLSLLAELAYTHLS
jgi:hypothetical protein